MDLFDGLTISYNAYIALLPFNKVFFRDGLAGWTSRCFSSVTGASFHCDNTP